MRLRQSVEHSIVQPEHSASGTAGDVATSDLPPVRDLAFSMLSLLCEAAAAHMCVELAGAVPAAHASPPSANNIREARAAIDGANALLASMRDLMEPDALRAVESMLTQLQIEYVRHAGRLS
jgi:hypothetical protein